MQLAPPPHTFNSVLHTHLHICTCIYTFMHAFRLHTFNFCFACTPQHRHCIMTAVLTFCSWCPTFFYKASHCVLVMHAPRFCTLKHRHCIVATAPTSCGWCLTSHSSSWCTTSSRSCSRLLMAVLWVCWSALQQARQQVCVRLRVYVCAGACVCACIKV